MNHPPSFTLEMGEFKVEMTCQIIHDDLSSPTFLEFCYEKVIKRSIGEDYFTEMTFFVFDEENAGEMVFKVYSNDYDNLEEETNMRGEDFIENFKQKWNDSPIVAALANIGLAGISRME